MKKLIIIIIIVHLADFQSQRFHSRFSKCFHDHSIQCQTGIERVSQSRHAAKPAKAFICFCVQKENMLKQMK